MGADRTFLLRGLTDGEASRLFENKVGDKLKDNEELKSIADQVVKKLAAMGLGLFERFNKTIQASRDRLNDMLSELRSACLLLDGGNDKDSVTIHDLYSEAVVSDAFSGPDSLMINNNYGLWPKEKLEKCWACLVNVGNDKLAELMLRQFPHVKILMLSEQADMGDRSRIDFTYMEELRVLYLRSMHITSLPSSMEILGNLQSLSINCHVEDVANLGKLKALQILSFAGLVELRSMTKLNSLEISIRDPILLLEVDDLPFEKLTRFWINIGNVEGREFKGLRTMKINLEGHDSILSKIWVRKTLQKTQYLCLDRLGEFENACELCIQEFPQLKHLDIHNSPSIKYIVSSSNSVFTILESLLLSELINLGKICHGHIAAECFSKLKAVSVKKCNRLEYLWSLSHVQNLVQLENIDVWNCNSMRAIARKDMVPADCRVELPYLRHLYLANLPNMRSFCSRAEMTSEGTPIQARVMDEGGGDEGTELVTPTLDLQNTYSDSFFDKKASLPNLEDFKLDSMGSFKRIWPDELFRSSFYKLDTITIENCSDLLHIFPSTIIGRLHNLKSVEVENCPSLKSLFDFGSLDSNTEQNVVLLPELVTFPNMRCLRINGVPCKELWNNQIPTDSFQKLEYLSLNKCENLQCIATSYMWKKLQHCLEKLKVISCRLIKIIYEGDGMDTEIGKLRRLGLFNLKNLTQIWQFDGLPNIPFPNLRDVQVLWCPHLEMLFTTFTAKLLGQIEELIVESCEDMELIAGHEKGEEVTRTAITFSKLIALKLSKLPKFRRFFLSEKYSLTFRKDFPSLRGFSIESCGAKPDQVLGDLKNHITTMALENRLSNLRSIDSSFFILHPPVAAAESPSLATTRHGTLRRDKEQRALMEGWSITASSHLLVVIVPHTRSAAKKFCNAGVLELESWLPASTILFLDVASVISLLMSDVNRYR
ncbi:uncharacterized protein LOC104454990 [Eucalyptus grandis]|uniref:uncharacterized protein LOC104454990 n=1 Tax=Eucalyptus grandis TaxID=71139 RepID=UPI00192EEE60|nr:uncharacterized protein LOC104454990 [Eucalyptus grandis]